MPTNACLHSFAPKAKPHHPPGETACALPGNQHIKHPRMKMAVTPRIPELTTQPPLGHTVARNDIRASAEKILYTYLLPGSEREIMLPESMVSTIINLVEDDGRDDPEVFDPAKDYVFQAMERDAFPGFLQAKALGNMVPLSIILRLAFALISFGGGFWGAFYVVLRNKPRNIRCWVC